MLTSYGDVARYNDEITGELVGGYYGFFIKAPGLPRSSPTSRGVSTTTALVETHRTFPRAEGR